MAIISNTLLKGSDDFEVEFTILQQENSSELIEEDNCWVDYDIDRLNSKIAKLDKDIDVLTNDADQLDNAIAVASGLLCGLIDSFFVGEFSFMEGMEITNEKMEQKIIKLAKKHGWEGIKKGERKGQMPLDAAIAFLEDKFKMPSDPLEHQFGGTRQHHLRDFAHHHSPIGLFFSILTQLTGRAYGTDTNGVFMSIKVPEEMIGTDWKKKWAIAVTDWALHLASDMHGSSATAGAGTGIPGPIVSLLKAISALPIWGTKPHIPGEQPNPNSLSLFTAKLYNGTLLGQRDENGKLVPVKIDLRGEKAIWQQMGKQSVPVIINDVLVRVFYFIRRLYIALKDNDIHSWNDITKLNWRKIIPVYNRTINHMMLVASGTFVAVDFGDAAIRSAIKCGGSWEKFAAEMLLRINYPGIGRFVVALGVEGHMELRRNKKRTERMALVTELLQAKGIEVFNTQKQMWIAADQAETTIENLYNEAEKSYPLIVRCLKDNKDDYDIIESYEEGIVKNNPWIIESIKIEKMNTTEETKQSEMVNAVEPAALTEELDEKELEKRTTETIVALVNQANAISAENSSIEETPLYEGVDDPKQYIDKIAEHEFKAKENYAKLEQMKKAHFWTIGRNKAKVEQTQEVLDDIIEAVNNNANASKALFNNQVKLAIFSKKLYAIGIMGIASNRLVVREIKKRLEHASQEELNELARHELESVVNELQQQQRLERKVDENHLYVLKELESANNKVNKNRDYSEKKFEEVKDELASFEKQSQASIENQEKSNKAFHSEMQNLFSKKSEDLDKELKRMEEIHDSFKKDLNKTLDEKIQGLTNLHKQFVIDQTSTIDKLEGQIKNYKIVAILAGIISIASLIMVFF